MEFNLSLPRVLLLIALIALFGILGGFSIPEIHDEFRDPHRVRKAWFYCVLMYLAGAGCVSIVDHYVGTMDRSNLRLFYIVAGIALMISGYVWQKDLRTPAPVKTTTQTTVANCVAVPLCKKPSGLSSPEQSPRANGSVFRAC